MHLKWPLKVCLYVLLHFILFFSLGSDRISVNKGKSEAWKGLSCRGHSSPSLLPKVGILLISFHFRYLQEQRFYLWTHLVRFLLQ